MINIIIRIAVLLIKLQLSRRGLVRPRGAGVPAAAAPAARRPQYDMNILLLHYIYKIL